MPNILDNARLGLEKPYIKKINHVKTTNNLRGYKMRVIDAFFSPLLYDLQQALPGCRCSTITSGIEVATNLGALAQSGILPNVVASYQSANESAQKDILCKLVITADLNGTYLLCDISVFIEDMEKPYCKFHVRHDISLCSNTNRGTSDTAGLAVMAGQIMAELKDKRCFVI